MLGKRQVIGERMSRGWGWEEEGRISKCLYLVTTCFGCQC